MKLGDVSKVTLDDAQKRAKIIFGKVAEGKDPANEKAEARQTASHTLGAKIGDYLQAKVATMKPRSYEETKRHLENHWEPLHGLALASTAAPMSPPRFRPSPKKAGLSPPTVPARRYWPSSAGQ